MPYLNGDRTTDASGNGLLDGLGNLLETPPFDFNEIINWLRGLVDAVALTGAYRPLTIGAGVAALLEQLTGVYPASATLADYVASIYDFTRPSNPVSSNIPHALSDLQDYLEAQIGLVRYDASTPHNATVQDVLDVIGAGPGVELPPTPPVGWPTSPSVEAIWAYTLNTLLGGVVSADMALSNIWSNTHMDFLYAGKPIKYTPHFTVDALAAWGGYWPTAFQGVLPDYTDIQADDTVLSWLTRTVPDRDWEADDTTGLICTYTNLEGEYHTRIDCTLTDSDLQAIRAGYGNTAVDVGNVPPIWPGLANVTLGTPVALSSNLTVTGPLDGVLVNVTTPPTKLSEVVIGGISYWYRVGEVTFLSDNGEAEPFQYLGFQNAIYTPRFMKQAASAKLRVLGGAEGTATPYTIAV